jgi:hypothetical protein
VFRLQRGILRRAFTLRDGIAYALFITARRRNGTLNIPVRIDMRSPAPLPRPDTGRMRL